MTLPAWDKFLKQTEFLKDILDKYDELRAENTDLKAKLRKFEGRTQKGAQLELIRLENEVKKLRSENSYLKKKYNYNPEEDDEWD